MDTQKSRTGDHVLSLAGALDFEAVIPPDGYGWWYVDALSDDHACGLTIIAFIGSVFSPYYARARRLGAADPENHVALNVALYGRGGKRWCMTERGRHALVRTGRSWRLGASQLVVEDEGLSIEIDEWTVPWPSRLRGQVRVTPCLRLDDQIALDPAGCHRWSPLAPRCRVEVAMDHPSRHWQGTGYLDRNQGDRPLEADFSYWDWSRVNQGDDIAILYDVVRRDGSEQSLGLSIDRQARLTPFTPPARQILPPNSWRVPRRTQSEGNARLLRTFEDTPFYSRSLIETRLLGKTMSGMHESLSLDRFRRGWVQTLLPFRMPRFR